MYFKVSIRINPATGDPGGYYRLVESYRNVDGRVCHRTLLNVGFMNEVQAEDHNRIQKLLDHRCRCSDKELFRFEYEKESPVVQKYVDTLYARLIHEKKIDVPVLHAAVKERLPDKDRQTIDMNSLRNKDIREMGGEWLCYQALEQLGVGRFLSVQADWSPDDVRLALTHIISRAVYPASELKTCRWIIENSAVCELTGFPAEQITKDRLYTISRRLYMLKEGLETYLSHRTNELFDIQDKIILYDLTNTFFEGEKRGSQLARRGRSKEKRTDAKLVVLALVINPFGFIKYSSILQGNISDPATLEATIKDLRSKTSTTAEKALVVIDAGIATEENLMKIRKEGYDYLCVSRNKIKDYEIVADSPPVTVLDNRKRKIELQRISPAKLSDEGVREGEKEKEGMGEEYYLKVESPAKKKKELSMNDYFRDRYLKRLAVIAGSLSKKGGVKQENKVYERIGRLKQKYPSIHKYYQIDYQVEEQKNKNAKTPKRIITSMTWNLKPELDANARCGIYFLRTSLNNDNQILWNSYNTIRDLEYTFRVLKSELDMRPIFHKKDEHTMAHLHLAILAYWVVNTVRHQLKKEKINLQWNEIIRIMNTQKAVTTIAQNDCDQVIMIRRCSEPNEKVKQIYQTLKYTTAPFKKKKSVVHKSEFKKNETPYFHRFHSD